MQGTLQGPQIINHLPGILRIGVALHNGLPQ